MPVTKQERIEAFLAEYEELVRKYGVFVTSCGCCPDFVNDAEGRKDAVDGYLTALR